MSRDKIEHFRNTTKFDAEWYLQQYPDVRMLSIDPAEHFLNFGIHLNRSPTRTLNAEAYRQLARDTQKDDASVTSFDTRTMPTASISTPNIPQSAQPKSQSAVRLVIEKFIDREWYAERNSNFAQYGRDPLEHYIEFGKFGLEEPTDPHPLFSARHYIACVLRRKVQISKGDNLLWHFLTFGVKADCDPHPCFSLEWYRTKYNLPKDVNGWIDYILNHPHTREPNWLFSLDHCTRLLGGSPPSTITALQWYLEHPERGSHSPHAALSVPKSKDGSNPDEDFYINYFAGLLNRDLSPTALLNRTYYINQRSNHKLACNSALADYLLYGESAGVRPNPLFDPTWYRNTHNVPSSKSPLIHYLEQGAGELLDPCLGFSTRYYLETNRDVVLARKNAFEHFIAAGQREGRRPHLLFDISWYRTRIAKEWTDKALQHFIEVGVKQGQSPHPGIKIKPWASPMQVLATLFHDSASASRTLDVALTSTQSNRLSSIIFPQYDKPTLDAIRSVETARHEIDVIDVQRLKANEHVARKSDLFDYRKSQELKNYIRQKFDSLRQNLPAVSVIVPIHNRASVIHRAIESIASQTHKDTEIILIDDGSTDNTAKVLDDWELRDPRIKRVHQQCKGVSGARNTGLNLARREYIAYLDSDNYWEPDYLEIMLMSMSITGARTAYAALRQITDTGKILYRGDEYDRRALDRENYIDMNVFMHHRSVLDEGLRFNEQLRRCVDWDFIRRASLLHAPSYVPIIGCNYVDTSKDFERITSHELPGDFYRLSAAQMDLSEHTVGRTGGGSVSFSIVWPILQENDRSAIFSELWKALWHLRRSRHELIIINNNLDNELSSFLNAIARSTERVRVINLWRTFMRLPAANVGSSLARGKRVLFWDSSLEYNPGEISSLVAQLAENKRLSAVCPAISNGAGRTISHIGMLDGSSSIVQRILDHLPLQEVSHEVYGVACLSFPLCVDLATFRSLDGFDYNFSLNWGVADFCLRLLARSPDLVKFNGATRLTQRGESRSLGAPSQATREWTLFREQWTGKLRITPKIGSRRFISPARSEFEVVDWTLISKANSGFLQGISTSRAKRFAIHCPAPVGPDGLAWGDLYFAEGIARGLEKLGHSVALRRREEWSVERDSPNVVLHLRGIVDVRPVPGALNVLWVISHPEKVSAEEISGMDVILVASKQAAEAYHRQFGISPVVFPQAVDPRRFSFLKEVRHRELSDSLLFVGNSRRQPRPIILDAVSLGLPLIVYGNDWDFYIGSKFVKGTHIPNDQLGSWYRSAGSVLNDHWPSMRQWGIVSNRLFDVVAAGGIAISDHINGISELFDGHVRTYKRIDELLDLARNIRGWAPTMNARAEASKRILGEHSFDMRAQQLLELVH